MLNQVTGADTSPVFGYWYPPDPHFSDNRHEKHETESTEPDMAGTMDVYIHPETDMLVLTQPRTRCVYARFYRYGSGRETPRPEYYRNFFYPPSGADTDPDVYIRGRCLLEKRPTYDQFIFSPLRIQTDTSGAGSVCNRVLRFF